MSADADAVLFGQTHHARHHFRIARMESAGDICRRDDFHKFLVVADLIDAETFAHIGINIDLHGSLSLFFRIIVLRACRVRR
ncbi:hypothetical protein D3C71_1034050 [compost metagenome]